MCTAYPGARPPQQGPGDGTQRDQGVGGGAGQPAGWVRPRDRQTVNGRSDGVGLLDWIRFYGTLCRFVTFVRYLTYTPSVSIYTGPSYVPVPFVAPFVAIYSHNRRTRRRRVCDLAFSGRLCGPKAAGITGKGPIIGRGAVVAPCGCQVSPAPCSVNSTASYYIWGPNHRPLSLETRSCNRASSCNLYAPWPD